MMHRIRHGARIHHDNRSGLCVLAACVVPVTAVVLGWCGHKTTATITRTSAGRATAAVGGQAHRTVTVPPGPAAPACPARALSRAARASRRTAMALAAGREARYLASSGSRELSAELPARAGLAADTAADTARRLVRAEM